MPAHRHLLAVLLSVAPFGLPLFAGAQEMPSVQTRQNSIQMANLATELARMRYDVSERGPLLCVIPTYRSAGYFRIKRPLPGAGEPGPTPLALADAFDRVLLKAGSLTVLAPKDLTVINTRPGKPNLLTGLSSRENGQALLGTLSEAQWRKAGSDGLSLTDLTPEQAQLLQDAWPHFTGADPMKTEASPDNPQITRYLKDGDRLSFRPEQLRLRLFRTPTYYMTREGRTDSGYVSGARQDTETGRRIWIPADDHPSESHSSTYGVSILQTAPNRLKRGEIDFAAPALDGAVSLDSDGGQLTLGALLERVSKATHLELRADARIAVLPVVLRSTPNQSVRAGDVLMALAYSVTGAYRRLSDNLFLLTDDVDGIGARFVRLQAWADAAQRERQDLLTKSTEQASKQNPGRFLQFAPGQTALPDDLRRKVEAAWASQSSEGASLPVSTLPTEVKKDVEAAFQTWEQMRDPVFMKKDRVTVSMSLKGQWVLPNGEVLSASNFSNSGLDFDYQNLSQFVPKNKPAPPAPAAAKPDAKTVKPAAMPSVFPASVTRRVFVFNPSTVAEARQLMQAAHARGFNEFWVYVPLANADPTILKATLAWGKARKLPVGVATSLLRHTGIGEPERTILNQTGAQWADAYVGQALYEQHPEWRHDAQWQSDRYIDWMTLPSATEETTLTTRLIHLAQTPGLAGLCVKESTPPGYGGDGSSSSGLMDGGEMGYTLEQRIAFVRDQGIDPIDIVPDVWSVNVDKSLPFFPHESGERLIAAGDGKLVKDTQWMPPPTRWKRYRDSALRPFLSRVYGDLRTALPKLPLYLDDRASSYASANVSWFGSWDAPDRLPINPVYSNDSDGAGAAQAASAIRLSRAAWDRLSHQPQEPTWFNSNVARAAKRAEKPGLPWQGVALDLTTLDAKDALHLLNALPVSTPSATNR